MSVDDEGRTSAAFSAMPQPFISPHHASIVRKVVTQKNSFNIVTGDSSIPDIKLIRTDTTLDLSQKAEKGMPVTDAQGSTKYICTSKKLKLEIWVEKLKA